MKKIMLVLVLSFISGQAMSCCCTYAGYGEGKGCSQAKSESACTGATYNALPNGCSCYACKWHPSTIDTSKGVCAPSNTPGNC